MGESGFRGKSAESGIIDYRTGKIRVLRYAARVAI